MGLPNIEYDTEDYGKIVYCSNFQWTSHIDGKATCCFPGCTETPDITSEEDVVGNRKLHKPLCECHAVIFSVYRPNSWGRRKLYYGLWDRTPILMKALGYDPDLFPSMLTKEYWHEIFLPKFQKLINEGKHEDAKKMGKFHSARFDSDHILGDKGITGNDFIVPLEKGAHSGKTTLLGDNIVGNNTYTTAQRYYNALTDEVLIEMRLDYTQEDLGKVMREIY